MERIVGEFVDRAKKKRLGERFNMFLSASREQYLDRAAEGAGLTKSEYVRELIEKDKVKTA